MKMITKKMLPLLVIIILSFIGETIYAFSISSGYGWRINPITNKKEFHKGIDIPGKLGMPIEALFDGDIIFANSYGGYGQTVIIHHKKDTYTLYAHCSEITVLRGQKVKAGQIIALVGNTGLSTGPHLHLEYWVNNQYVNPLEIWKTKGTNK